MTRAHKEAAKTITITIIASIIFRASNSYEYYDCNNKSNEEDDEEYLQKLQEAYSESITLVLAHSSLSLMRTEWTSNSHRMLWVII